MAHHEEKNFDNEPQGQKPSAAKRTINPSQGGPQESPGATNRGGPDQEHDLKHREGSFTGKGDHARTGNRGHQ